MSKKKEEKRKKDEKAKKEETEGLPDVI